MDENDAWWSPECAGWDAPVAHAACDLSGCDCSCHHPPAFQDLGGGEYRVPGAKVSPTTGRYVTTTTKENQP